jgi:hypothetical protein
VHLNGKAIGEFQDVAVHNALLKIWLGDRPAEASLKRQLLGQKSEAGTGRFGVLIGRVKRISDDGFLSAFFCLSITCKLFRIGFNISCFLAKAVFRYERCRETERRQFTTWEFIRWNSWNWALPMMDGSDLRSKIGTAIIDVGIAFRRSEPINVTNLRALKISRNIK